MREQVWEQSHALLRTPVTVLGSMLPASSPLHPCRHYWTDSFPGRALRGVDKRSEMEYLRIAIVHTTISIAYERSTVTVPDDTPSPRSRVTLREISADTVRTICSLSVREEQRKFVAPNAVSIAQAYFSRHAWFRAIYADETPAGFLMLEDQPEKPEYYLWRFMIDARYQGMGFGHRALKLLIEHVRTRPNATELLTSVRQAEGGPQEFYEKMGFELTGEQEEGEALMRLHL
jgi:diamine N-acetyltransferase